MFETTKNSRYLLEMASKRKREKEFEDVSSVQHTSPNVKFLGLVTMVSPMKNSKTCSYFNGQISDSKSRKWVFKFDAGFHRKLLEHHGKEEAVLLSHCEVKQAWIGEQLEVLVNKSTETEQSSKQFDFCKDTWGVCGAWSVASIIRVTACISESESCSCGGVLQEGTKNKTSLLRMLLDMEE